MTSRHYVIRRVLVLLIGIGCLFCTIDAKSVLLFGFTRAWAVQGDEDDSEQAKYWHRDAVQEAVSNAIDSNDVQAYKTAWQACGAD